VVLWYNVTFKHLRLVAAASLLPCAQGWEVLYQVGQEIYESGPDSEGSNTVLLILGSVDLHERDDIADR
jgi:hypothetical protein